MLVSRSHESMVEISKILKLDYFRFTGNKCYLRNNLDMLFKSID